MYVAVSVCGALVVRRAAQQVAPQSFAHPSLAENDREISRLLTLIADSNVSDRAVLALTDRTLARLRAQDPPQRLSAALTEPYAPLPFKDALRTAARLSAAAVAAEAVLATDAADDTDTDTDAAARAAVPYGGSRAELWRRRTAGSRSLLLGTRRPAAAAAAAAGVRWMVCLLRVSSGRNWPRRRWRRRSVGCFDNSLFVIYLFVIF